MSDTDPACKLLETSVLLLSGKTVIRYKDNCFPQFSCGISVGGLKVVWTGNTFSSSAIGAHEVVDGVQVPGSSSQSPPHPSVGPPLWSWIGALTQGFRTLSSSALGGLPPAQTPRGSPDERGKKTPERTRAECLRACRCAIFSFPCH